MFSKVLKVLDEMDLIAEKRGAALAQVAINWNTQRDFVDTSLCGARSPKQALENCAGFDWELSEEEMAALNAAIEKYL